MDTWRLNWTLDQKIARSIMLTPEIVNQDIQKIVNDGMNKLQKRLRLKKEVEDRLWGILVDRVPLGAVNVGNETTG